MIDQEKISHDNLSLAWSNALSRCYSAPRGVLSPAIVEFYVPDDETQLENIEIRSAIEQHLGTLDTHEESIETVAGTIFPQSIWKLSRESRKAFYEMYAKASSRILRHHQNRNGIYFNRMIAYGCEKGSAVNQLEHVISIWNNGNARRSALQVAIFDPNNDHTNQRQRGFPCLQQIAFYPQGANGNDGLAVVAFYATQTLIEKGYGNYLGLYRLGKFMAKEMNLRLDKVMCISAALKLNNGKSKSISAQLVQQIKALTTNDYK